LIQIPLGYFPVRYLGLSLCQNYIKAKDCITLIDKFRHKIDGWVARLLFFSGRVELIKSVFFNVLGYWIQSYKLPLSVCKELERLAANIFGIGECMSETGILSASLSKRGEWVSEGSLSKLPLLESN